MDMYRVKERVVFGTSLAWSYHTMVLISSGTKVWICSIDSVNRWEGLTPFAD